MQQLDTSGVRLQDLILQETPLPVDPAYRSPFLIILESSEAAGAERNGKCTPAPSLSELRCQIYCPLFSVGIRGGQIYCLLQSQTVTFSCISTYSP